MAVISELIRVESDNTLSFGDYSLEAKAKLDNFSFEGGSYKVKTYKDITKLECNDMFVYESVPGTSVSCFNETADGADFKVTGNGDAQITVGLEDEQEYKVSLDGQSAGFVQTNLGGKLNISVDLSAGEAVLVEIIKC